MSYSILSELDRMRSQRHKEQGKQAIQSALIVTQLKEMKNVKREEDRVIDALRQKQQYEMAQFTAQLNKEQETMMKLHERDHERLLAKCAHELEAAVKAEAVDEKKFAKALKEKMTADLAHFQESKKKERKAAKAELKGSLEAAKTPSSSVKAQLKSLKESELERIGS